jgi:hypothetical protein
MGYINVESGDCRKRAPRLHCCSNLPPMLVYRPTLIMTEAPEPNWLGWAGLAVTVWASIHKKRTR